VKSKFLSMIGQTEASPANRLPATVAGREARSTSGLTRLDLLALVAGVSLLAAAVVWPALADGHPRSDRLVCVNNLRRIYVAMLEWGNDHNDQVPFAVPVSQGGTRLHPLAVNVWWHFYWISNELDTAMVLACPSDNGKVARDFSASPETGYINPAFRANATSYFLSHGGYNRVVWPMTYLAGDRNVTGGELRGDSIFGGQSFAVTRQAHWTNGLHYPMGNVARGDGQVLQLSDEMLRQATSGAQEFNGALWQYILPR
jgi:hypothetical protein